MNTNLMYVYTKEYRNILGTSLQTNDIRGSKRENRVSIASFFPYFGLILHQHLHINNSMTNRIIVGERKTALRTEKIIDWRTGRTQWTISRCYQPHWNRKDTASLGSLIKISRDWGVRLGTFLDDCEELGPVVSRAEKHLPPSMW